MIPRAFIRRLPRLHALGLSVLRASGMDIAAYRLYTLMGFNETGVHRGYCPVRHNRDGASILAHKTAMARMECGSTPNSERPEIHSRGYR